MAETKTDGMEERVRPGELSLFLSSSPHIVSPVTTARLMGNMLLALAPVTVYGVILFGLPALLTVIVSTVSAVAAESLFRIITGKKVRAADLSAGVTGLLLALVLPPSTPFWITALGAVFAVVAAKEFFGGLGANVFNPALAGRAFLLMSFPVALTAWHRPATGFVLRLPGSLGAPVDGISGVTPLGITSGESAAGVGKAFFASGLSSSADYLSTIRTLFTGNHAGSIGETSALLILAGMIFLLIKKTIDWRAPLSMIAASFITAFAVGLDPLFSVLSGGLLFGAVFMTTDYVTSPLAARGKWIFGAGAGIIVILIRKWGSYPEGVTYGILIMNAFVPFLNRLLPRKYGFTPKKKASSRRREPGGGTAK
ncbi:MAG: RnfABCDGE type electron transport complex subunit D [Treponema sp.]|jgi:electron transport complex protein RnfD|nr:RnfABCDGE type electron transport complex subunit D [Treponema sp.]